MSEDNLISQIKKCISFIYAPNEKEGNSPIGTGFWILVKVEDKPEKQLGYFVTAKHVLLDKNGEFLPQVRLRHGTLDGSLAFVPIEINPETILTHADKDVDIAVIQTVLNPKVFDFKGIPSEWISTDNSVKKVGIREGDDVFFAGLFTSFLGTEKNHPIFRFGKVALLTDEKIVWKEGDNSPVMIRLYLIECQSFGGNSGSPVFFNLSPIREPGVISAGPAKISLAGIMKGSFLSANEVIERSAENKERLLSYENVGISGIIPAFQLHEILFRNDVVELRKNAVD